MPDSSAPSRVVARDRERFRRFYPERRAVIPPDACGEIAFTSVHTLIERRRAELIAQAEAAKA